MKNELKGKKEGLGGRIAAWLWVAAAFLIDAWYQIVPGKWILDSDLAAEMLLADLLNKEHAILSRNWFYSTELSIFEAQWFYRLGLLLFPNNWYMARVFAALLMTALLVWACVYFAKSVGLGIYGVWAAGFLILPFGFWHLFITVYGLYYMIYMYFSLFVAGLVIRWTEEKKPHQIILAGLLSFCAGCNGARQLIIFFAPLCLTALILLLIRLKGEKITGIPQLREKAEPEFRFSIAAIAATACNLLGYCANAFVFSRQYCFDSLSGFTWGTDVKDPVEATLDFLKLFGYLEGVKVVSMRGLASLCGVLIALVLVVFACMLFRKQRDDGFRGRIPVFLFPVMFVFQLIVFAFLGNYRINYWLPLLCFAVVTVAMGFRELTNISKSLRTALIAAFSLCVLIASFGAIRDETSEPLRGKPGLLEMSEWLAENDYDVVVASFWNGNQITEFTNGKVEVYLAVPNAESGYPWLQKVSHEKLPERDYVQIVNTVDGERIENYDAYPNVSLLHSVSGIEAYYID